MDAFGDSFASQEDIDGDFIEVHDEGACIEFIANTRCSHCPNVMVQVEYEDAERLRDYLSRFIEWHKGKQ